MVVVVTAGDVTRIIVDRGNGETFVLEGIVEFKFAAMNNGPATDVTTFGDATRRFVADSRYEITATATSIRFAQEPQVDLDAVQIVAFELSPPRAAEPDAEKTVRQIRFNDGGGE